MPPFLNNNREKAKLSTSGWTGPKTAGQPYDVRQDGTSVDDDLDTEHQEDGLLVICPGKGQRPGPSQCNLRSFTLSKVVQQYLSHRCCSSTQGCLLGTDALLRGPSFSTPCQVLTPHPLVPNPATPHRSPFICIETSSNPT